jgi:hypothetical protein
MNKLKPFLIALVICTSQLSFAESPADFAFVFLDSDQDNKVECTLRERGWAVIKNPIMVAGKRIGDENDCVVEMPITKFKTMFQMCSLVGFNANNTLAQSCEFNTTREDSVEFASDPGFIRIRRDLPATNHCVWACKLSSHR